MGLKGRWMWESTLDEEPGAACATGFWEEKRGTKREVRGIQGSAGIWNETQAITIVGGEIRRKAKAHKR